jgi:hypothetical protein
MHVQACCPIHPHPHPLPLPLFRPLEIRRVFHGSTTWVHRRAAPCLVRGLSMSCPGPLQNRGKKYKWCHVTPPGVLFGTVCAVACAVACAVDGLMSVAQSSTLKAPTRVYVWHLGKALNVQQYKSTLAAAKATIQYHAIPPSMLKGSSQLLVRGSATIHAPCRYHLALFLSLNVPLRHSR